jgi:hypothetical protein
MTWEVRVVEHGRSGYIEYLENGQACQCYWEFGGGDTIAIIWVPASVEWDAKYPWAKGRRQEVLQRIATETRSLRAPAAVIEWDDPRNCIYLKQK